MKFSFSNILAIASILVWATAWAATEKNADAEMAPRKAPVITSTNSPTLHAFSGTRMAQAKILNRASN